MTLITNFLNLNSKSKQHIIYVYYIPLSQQMGGTMDNTRMSYARVVTLPVTNIKLYILNKVQGDLSNNRNETYKQTLRKFLL